MKHTHDLSAFRLSFQDNLHNNKRKAVASPWVMNKENVSNANHFEQEQANILQSSSVERTKQTEKYCHLKETNH